MKKQSRSHLLYLEDMLLVMNRIAGHIAGLHFHRFKQDYKTVDAVIRNFEIIGEVSKKNTGFYQERISPCALGRNVFVKK